MLLNFKGVEDCLACSTAGKHVVVKVPSMSQKDVNTFEKVQRTMTNVTRSLETMSCEERLEGKSGIFHFKEKKADLITVFK